MAELEKADFNEILEGQAFVDWVYTCWAESKAVYGPRWDELHYLWDVVAGEGMPEADKRLLEQTGRPDIDPPFAAGIVDTIMGAEMGRQAEARFEGVDSGLEDQVIAGWITQLVRTLMAKCNGHHYQVAGYREMLVGGYGFTVQFLDDTRPTLFPVLRPLHYWEVWPDPWAKEQNLEDANFFTVETTWRTEDAVAKWPGKKAEIETAKIDSKARLPHGAVLVSGSIPSRGAGSLQEQPGVKILTHYYRRSMKKVVWVEPGTGEKQDTVEAEYRARQKELAAAQAAATAQYEADLAAWAQEAAPPLGFPVAPSRPQPQPPAPLPQLLDEEAHFYNGHCYYRAYLVGEEASKASLLENEKVKEDEFAVKVMTGFPWMKGKEKRVRFYGMMRKLVDIQEWYTRVMRTWIELMGRAVKNGGFFEESAFASPQQAEKFVTSSSAPGMWHAVQDGAVSGGKISPLPSAPQQPGIAELYKTLMDMFGLISGVTPLLQGTFMGDRSNVLVSNLQEQGLQMLAPIREPRTKYIVDCGRFMAKLALAYMPAGEIDRLLGVQKVEGMTVQKDPATGEEAPITGADGEPVTAGKILKRAQLLDYDTVVDVGLATSTQRQAVAEVFFGQGVLKAMLDAGVPQEILVPELVRNSHLPGDVGKQMADRLEAHYERQKMAQSAEGMVQIFQEIAQGDPNAAQQLFGQLQQILGQVAPQGGQGAPPAGLPM